MNDRPTKTFHITIDSDSANTVVRGDDVSARHAAREMKRVGRTPFRVDITEDENGKPHFEFTELEEPKVEYWVGNTFPTMPFTLAPHDYDMKKFPNVWRKDTNGDFILLNPEEKAKVIEEWKNS